MSGSPVKGRVPIKSVADPRLSIQEVLAELDATRKDYATASLQLQQQATLIAQLKDAEIRKDALVAHLEDQVRDNMVGYQQEIGIVNEETKTKQLEAEHKIRYLELEVGRLTEENSIYSRFESENKEMRLTLMKQQEQMEKLQAANEDMKHKARDDMSEFRVQLEAEFKRRLAESEKKFQAEAYRALSEEAKIALQGNDHLQTVLQKQNDSIESVLGRCKQLEQSHSKMKMEQELSQQSLQLHQAEVQKLRKLLNDSKTRCAQLEDSLKQRRIERASLELLYMEYESTRKDLQKTQDKLRRAQRASDRWKNRATALQHEDGGAAGMRPPGPRLSRNLLADKYSMAATRGASRETGLSGSEEELGYDSFADGEEDADGQTVKVDPMEILAMWNVNFENWKPPGAADEDDADKSAEELGADQGIGPRPPSKERPIKVRHTVEKNRLAKDRELSVLSKRKFKTLPPNPEQFTSKKTGANPYHPFAVSKSQAAFGAKPGAAGAPAGGARFLVP